MPEQSVYDSIIQYMDGWNKIIHTPRPGWKYSSLTDYIQKNGAFLSNTPFTPEEEQFLLKVFHDYNKAFKSRECFKNATSLFLFIYWSIRETEHDIAYGEGIAQGIIPVEHAVLILNNKPVDITWRDPSVNKSGKLIGNRTKSAPSLLVRVKANLDANAYYMVKYGVKEISQAAIETGTYGVIRPSLCKESS